MATRDGDICQLCHDGLFQAYSSWPGRELSLSGEYWLWRLISGLLDLGLFKEGWRGGKVHHLAIYQEP